MTMEIDYEAEVLKYFPGAYWEWDRYEHGVCLVGFKTNDGVFSVLASGDDPNEAWFEAYMFVKDGDI